MPQYITTNRIGPGTQVDLGATLNQSVVIVAGVVIGPTDNARAIYGTGLNQSVYVHGFVGADQSALVYLSGENAFVGIGITGVLEALEPHLTGSGTAAVYLSSGGAVSNQGLIRGDWCIGIAGNGTVANTGLIESYSFRPIDIDNNAVITNSGTISSFASTGTAIEVGGTLSLTNSGLIFGGIDCAGNHINNVLNTGTINGLIRLNEGDDLYYGRFGIVAGAVFGGAGNDTLTGGDGGNTLSGGTENDLVQGGAGRDYLRGDDGVDTIEGNSGDDHLWGGANADEHWGGDGIDYARYDDQPLGAVSASLANPSGNTGLAAGDTYIGIEGLVGGAGADTLSGDGAANYLFGGDGSDQILGGAGDDFLWGDTTGANGLASGGDNLWGGAGADRHYGGDGTDYARYDDGAHGNLTISLADPTMNTGAAAGDSYISIEGLVGGAGADVIIGNAAANFLFGSGGADFIDGLGGNDHLNGGAAADRFRFSTALGAGNIDTISDFQNLVDDILLAQSVFAGIGPSLTADEFRIGVAQDANDRILYNPGTGQLFYDGNGNAAGGMIQFATVTIGTVLTFDDFIMV